MTDETIPKRGRPKKIEEVPDLDDSDIDDPEPDGDVLARLVIAWRGDLPTSRAGQMLGMSKRTIEGIEQGRGFRYPKLLVLALKAFE